MTDHFHQKLHHVVPTGLSGDTAQTSGMTRVEAISGKTVGSDALWMGETHVAASTASGDHHHGAVLQQELGKLAPLRSIEIQQRR